MNKELAYKLSCYQGLSHITTDVEFPEPEFTEDALMSVLNEIFSVDPITNMPKGDIAYYLAPDSNPSLKAWLETHLLKPRGIISIDNGLPDDFKAEFSKRADESYLAYQNRLLSIKEAALSDFNDLKSRNPEFDFSLYDKYLNL